MNLDPETLLMVHRLERAARLKRVYLLEEIPTPGSSFLVGLRDFWQRLRGAGQPVSGRCATCDCSVQSAHF